MKLTLPYPPSSNNLYANTKGGRRKTEVARLYAIEAGWTARQQGAYILVGELRATYHVYMPRRADTDNRVKACQDSLKGIAFEDDIQIAEVHIYRHRAQGNPRIEVEIEGIEA